MGVGSQVGKGVRVGFAVAVAGEVAVGVAVAVNVVVGDTSVAVGVPSAAVHPVIMSNKRQIDRTIFKVVTFIIVLHLDSIRFGM
jgi:hypothetical protein